MTEGDKAMTKKAERPLRMTSARKAVLDVLEQTRTHLTAQQILERLAGRLPSINISTVYRAVEYLAAAGLVSISDMGVGSPVYESVAAQPHHHLVCSACGTILTLQDEEVAPLLRSLTDRRGFVLKTNHLVLYGLCHNCQQGPC